jgi:hypothetical protein
MIGVAGIKVLPIEVPFASSVLSLRLPNKLVFVDEHEAVSNKTNITNRAQFLISVLFIQPQRCKKYSVFLKPEF